MRGLFNMFGTGLRLLRRGLVWWVESFGQMPGVTRDSALSAPGLHDDAAADLSRAARELADEMTWGSSLRPDGPEVSTRVRM